MQAFCSFSSSVFAEISVATIDAGRLNFGARESRPCWITVSVGRSPLRPEAQQAVRALHRAFAGEVENRRSRGTSGRWRSSLSKLMEQRVACPAAGKYARWGGSWPTRDRRAAESERRDGRTIQDWALRRLRASLRQEFGPNVPQHDVQIDSARCRAGRHEPKLRRQLPEPRTAPLGRLRVDGSTPTSCPSRRRQSLSSLMSRGQPDAVDFTDDADLVGELLTRFSAC